MLSRFYLIPERHGETQICYIKLTRDKKFAILSFISIFLLLVLTPETPVSSVFCLSDDVECIFVPLRYDRTRHRYRQHVCPSRTGNASKLIT